MNARAIHFTSIKSIPRIYQQQLDIYESIFEGVLVLAERFNRRNVLNVEHFDTPKDNDNYRLSVLGQMSENHSERSLENVCAMTNESMQRSLLEQYPKERPVVMASIVNKVVVKRQGGLNHTRAEQLLY